MGNDLAQTVASTSQTQPPPLARTARFLTELEKRAICAERAGGVGLKDIADRYGVNPSTVWRVCTETQQATDTPALGASWRADLRARAVPAITAGLDCPDDPYKRAGIGVQVLKGLGDFAPDSQQVNVTAMLASAPAGIDLDATIDVTPTLPPSKDSE